MNKVQIKICGITRIEDAIYASKSGVNALGFVFYEKSPRYVDSDKAMHIIESLPPFITTVGLFVNHDAQYIRSILQTVRLDLLQFHGNETPEECLSYSIPYIKAIRMKHNVILSDAVKKYIDAKALLLDTYEDGTIGGTGQQFDWDRIPDIVEKPVILAGGLTPDNVAKAVRRINPYAVDVSGGVESDKGIKNHDKIKAFVWAVNNA